MLLFQDVDSQLSSLFYPFHGGLERVGLADNDAIAFLDLRIERFIGCFGLVRILQGFGILFFSCDGVARCHCLGCFLGCFFGRCRVLFGFLLAIDPRRIVAHAGAAHLAQFGLQRAFSPDYFPLQALHLTGILLVLLFHRLKGFAGHLLDGRGGCLFGSYLCGRPGKPLPGSLVLMDLPLIYGGHQLLVRVYNHAGGLAYFSVFFGKPCGLDCSPFF